MTPRQQRREAREILSTCTASTPRPTVAWAAGVITAQHAISFYRVPVKPEWFAQVHSGGSLDRARMYWANRKGFSIEDASVLVVAVTWPEVVTLIRPDVVTLLRPRIEACLAARKEHTGLEDRKRHSARYQVSPALSQAFHRAAQVIEDECCAVGAQVWESCRPDQQVGQLDLFDLLS